MQWDDALVQANARRLRLADAGRHAGGRSLARTAGASLEFHDHRDYAPGDDLRHLDWNAYGRSGQLLIRRFRAEVRPRLGVILDASASMGHSPAKARLAATLAALLLTIADADQAKPRLWLMGARPGPASDWRPALGAWTPTGQAPAPLADLAHGELRLLISDGLWPGGIEDSVHRLGNGATRLALVQVLTRDELDPQASGATRLIDHEGGNADLRLDDAACAAYRTRFARHQESWREALRGRGPGLITAVVEDGAEAAISALVTAGLLSLGQRR